MSSFSSKRSLFIFNCIKFGTFFVLMLLFLKGGVRNEIFPFAFGFYVALCWCNQNLLATSAVYVLANVIISPTINTLIQSAFCVAVILFCFFVHKKIKHRIPASLLVVYTLLSQSAYMFFNMTSATKIVPTFVYLILGVLFMFACIKIFKIVLVKGVGFRFTIDESICISLFFVALSSGLSAVDFAGFYVLNIVAVFFILFATFVYSSSTVPLVLAGSFGLGYALQTGSLSALGILVVLALCSVAFKSTNKYFAVMAIIIADVVLGLYFNAYGIYNYKILCCTVLGEILFLCIPNKMLAVFKTFLGDNNSANALRNMVNRSRDNLCKRLFSLSEVFAEMNRTFKDTIKGVLPAGEVKQMLKDELFQKVCGDCPEKHRCHRIMEKQTNEIIDSIISAGLDRGKVTILDIPPFLSTRCNRTTTILNCLNNLIASYKQYSYCVTNVDTSKALIAEEFNGVSKLLLTLADETKDLVTFNQELEEKIKEDLNYIDVYATEVYVYQKDENMVSCIITMRTTDLENPKLFSVIDKSFGVKMALMSKESAQVAGFVVATFSPAKKYDCIFGTAGVPKYGNKISGDSYSFVRLNGNKVLLALCDGMGSGDEAQRTSETAISLIENFYKAEFDDNIILSSVNKLLSMQMTENYSALDVCVIDLNDALGDFVKVGAPATIVKHADSTEVVEGSGALPIGILDEIKPSISKKMLSEGDIVLLASDGITDAFGDFGNLADFVNNCSTTNPQELANKVLEQAHVLSKDVPQDDMTVLCARLFVNI